MPFLAYLLIPMVIGVVFAGINKEVLKAEKNMDEINFVVRQSKIVIWLGIICTLFFGALFVLMSIFPKDTAEWWVYLIFSLFIFLGLFLTIYCIFWELRVNGSEIHFSTLFKHTKTFTFDMIDKVKIKNQNTPSERIVLYAKAKKILSVEPNCKGYNIFVARLKREHINFDQ